MHLFVDFSTFRLLCHLQSHVYLVISSRNLPLCQILSEDVAITDGTVLHSLNGLSCIFHRHLSDPRLDVLLRGQIQHLESLGLAADVTSTELASVIEEIEGHHGREGLLGKTDGDEAAVYPKHREIVLDGHVLRI